MQNTERASFERAPHREPDDDPRTSLLYPLMLIAAIAVIVFSIVGIASLTGVMPRSLSPGSPGAATEGGRAPAARSETPPPTAPAAGKTRSGVIKSIRAVQTKIAASGLRAFGVPGSEVTGGGSRLPLVAGGAHAGNDIMNAQVTYRVRVRMDDDGRLHTFYETSPPGYGVGQKVLVTERTILAAG